MFRKRKKRENKEIDITTITSKELKDRLSNLEVITVGAKAKDGQTITGRAYGTTYKITHERASSAPDFIVWVLRVFGPEDKRQELIKKFINLLGEPSNKFQIRGQSDIEYFYWENTQR